MAKRMTEDELRALTDSEMRQAVGYFSGKLANQRQKAMSYYLGNATGDLSPPEVDGRSSVVSPVVRNTVESMLPQLMVKFSGSDKVGEFQATKPGDEKAASQATDYLNHLFYTRNNGERIVYNWIKDALLQKNGILKVWWDTTAEEKQEEYRCMDEMELAQLLDDDEIEVVAQKSYPDEEDAKQRQQAIAQLTQQLMQAQEAAQMNPQAAQMAMGIEQRIQQIQAQPVKMLWDVTCKRTKDEGRLRVENVPPEEFLICRNAKDIETARFVAHRVARTRSDLESMGYKNIDQITGDDMATAFNAERIERLAWDDEMAYMSPEQVNTADDSQKIIWVTECYVRVDWDGTGVSQLRKVVRAGNQLLENEPCDIAPFVSITPVPMPHKFFGLSIADLAMESQRIETALLRGVLDNTYLQINGRYFAVEGQVNLDDLLTSRPGGVVRTKMPGAVGRLDQGQGNSELGMSMLEYTKGFNEDSTGWTRYNQGTDGDSLNQTASGAALITSRADMRLDLIARNFAEGFRDLFRMMLKLVSQYQDKDDVISLNGEWVNINPTEWRNGFSFNIHVGLGTGNKQQQIQQIMVMLAEQKHGLGLVATPENIYNALEDLTKAIGYKSADRFFTDPKKMPPKPPQQDPALIKIQADHQLKSAELAQTFEIKKAEMQMKVQSEIATQQAQADQMTQQQQNDAQLKQHEAELKAALEQQKMAHEAAMEAQRLEYDKWKAQLDNDTKVLIAQIGAQTSVKTASMGANSAAGELEVEELDEQGNPVPKVGLVDLVNSVNQNMANLIGLQSNTHQQLTQAVAQGNALLINEIRKPRKRTMQRSDGTVLTAFDEPAGG